LNSASSMAVHMADMGHMASDSGRMTFFSGERILALSAMKSTPQKTITSASVRAAICASPSESPT